MGLVFSKAKTVYSVRIVGIPENPPSWTEIAFHQCPDCPLDPDSHRYCPLALSIVDIVEHFDPYVLK